MTAPILIGILGCANIAKRSVIPAILNLPELFDVVGIASRSAAKAQETGRHFNIKPFDGYLSLLSEPDLDALYIPLPTALHAEWIRAALSHKLHCLVEKPLACSHQEILSLYKLAEENNCVLMETFQFRFHRQLQKIQELIHDGELGEIRHVSSWFGFPPFPDADNIRYQPSLAGGALMDAAGYPLRITQILLGKDIEVCGSRLSFDSEKGVDIFGSAFLRQCNGPLSSAISFGFDNHYQCNLTLWGSKGKLSTNRLFTPPPSYKATLTLENASGSRLIEIEPDDTFKNMLSHFSSMLRCPDLAAEEKQQNILQAALIEQIREMNQKS